MKLRDENRILSKRKTDFIINRMAYQIFENNITEKVVFVGINPGGTQLSKMLANSYARITKKNPDFCEIILNKKEPLSNPILLKKSTNELKGSVFILCDDVLNSGKTLAYSLSKLLTIEPHKVEIAVLILRDYGKYPVFVKYIGYEIATTLNEYVIFEEDKGVFLT